MLCQRCQKRVANVQITQVSEDSKNIVYICEQCAREEGHFNIGAPMNLSDFFSGIMGIPYMPIPKEIECEKCHMTYEEFKQIGKVGCAECYDLFEDKLIPVIKRLHGNTQYTGKYPARYTKEKMDKDEIQQLKESLNLAIKNEEYEDAAKLRDKIRELEGKG